MKKNRIASCKRTTKETDIELTINLDGQGKIRLTPGFLFRSYAGRLCPSWTF